jgi:uncharacterized protein YcfJ
MDIKRIGFGKMRLRTVTALALTGMAATSMAAAEYDTADVISAEPLTRQVRVSVPQRECYTETRYVPVTDSGSYGYDQFGNGRFGNGRIGRYGNDAPAAGQMIMGGLIGAVIGHQIGNQESRKTGAIAGAIIGSAIGHEAAQRSAARRADYGSTELRAVDAERCETRTVERYEERVDGYRVSYRYNGRIYTTNMSHDPGSTLRVRVNVAPLG